MFDSKKYRQEKKGEFNTRNRKYYQKCKLEVLSHYSNGTMGCACCGENRVEFLTINHLMGGGGKEKDKIKRYGSNFYTWLRKQGYPNGYNVLCFNCNCSIGFSGYCPHEKERSI